MYARAVHISIGADGRPTTNIVVHGWGRGGAEDLFIVSGWRVASKAIVLCVKVSTRHVLLSFALLGWFTTPLFVFWLLMVFLLEWHGLLKWRPWLVMWGGTPIFFCTYVCSVFFFVASCSIV